MLKVYLLSMKMCCYKHRNDKKWKNTDLNFPIENFEKMGFKLFFIFIYT